ncbi:unnamed protein product, partial [Rotaria magnacalcarata]
PLITEKVSQQPLITKEVLHQPLVTSTDTEIVEDSKKEDHQPVVLETTTEFADRVSTDALTDAVREIIGTPAITDVPTDEHVTEPVIEVLSTEETITTTEVTTTQEATVQPVAETEEVSQQPLITEEVLHQPLAMSTDTEIVNDCKKEDKQPVVLEPTTELADRVSTDSLIDAVRGIIATPVGNGTPTHEQVVERGIEVPSTELAITTTDVATTHEETVEPMVVTEDVLHQPLVTEEVSQQPLITKEVLHQPLVTSTDTEIVEDSKKEDHQPV